MGGEDPLIIHEITGALMPSDSTLPFKAAIPSSGWIATRLVSLPAIARSLMYVFLSPVLVHCTI